MSKKLFKIFVLSVSIVLLICSCATGSTESFDSEPSIVGIWKFKGEDMTSLFMFTADGKYVEDIIYSDGSSNYYFGDYEIDGEDLITSGYTYRDFILENRTLTLDGDLYKKTSSKAENNTGKLAGVWENDSELLGFTKDGNAIVYGSYNNTGDWESDDEYLRVKGEDSEYLIINDSLYIYNFRFIREYGTVKFDRKTKKGESLPSKLYSSSGWFYQRTGSQTVTGTQYFFEKNGKFNAINISDGKETGKYSGTFTFEEPFFVHLSNGELLTFAYIDNSAFGYSL